MRNVFGRQAIQWPGIMRRRCRSPIRVVAIWGNNWVSKVVENFPARQPTAIVEQTDAATRSYGRAVVSTDPPYYDNIGYSDLSDFFYVWLRRTLRPVYPALLSTMLVPKAEELVANPHRHDGRKSQAFLRGRLSGSICAHARTHVMTSNYGLVRIQAK